MQITRFKYWQINGNAGLISLRECYILINGNLKKMELKISKNSAIFYKYKNIIIYYRKLINN